MLGWELVFWLEFGGIEKDDRSREELWMRFGWLPRWCEEKEHDRLSSLVDRIGPTESRRRATYATTTAMMLEPRSTLRAYNIKFVKMQGDIYYYKTTISIDLS